MKMQFLVEVDVSESSFMGSKPTIEGAAKRIKDHIENPHEEIYYLRFNYNTIKVIPMGYQRVFNAIGDAVTRNATSLGISVEKFLNSLKG